MNSASHQEKIVDQARRFADEEIRPRAREFDEKSLKLKRPLPLFAITPECYMSVVNFAIKMGFTIYGTHEEFFIKNGIKYKQIITRL